MRGTRAKQIRKYAALVAFERAVLDAARPWHVKAREWLSRWWWGASMQIPHGSHRWCSKFLKRWYMTEGRYGG